MKERLGWLIRPMIAMGRDTRSLIREPETTLAKHTRALSAAFERRRATVAEQQVLADLHFAFVPEDERQRLVLDFQRDAVRGRQELCSDPIGSALLILIDAADARIRNGPLVLAAYLYERNEAALTACGWLLDAERCRSRERAARLFLAYIGKILESHYQRYIRVVDTLDSWCRGVNPRDGTFGQLMDRLAHRHPVLVQRDAARVRNAIEHGEYTLLPAERRVDLKNTNRGKTTWNASMTLDELSDMVADAERAADILFRALGLVAHERHAQVRVFDYVFAIGDAYAANDVARVNRLSLDYRDAMQRALAIGA